MPYTNYLDTQLNQEIFGSTEYAQPATIHVGLSTTAPTKSGTNVTEPSGGAYARIAVTNNTTNWHAHPSQPGTGQKQSNGVAINFAQATASWGTVTHFVIYDAAAAGNLLAYGALTASRTIDNGDTASFAIDALAITLD